MIDLVVPFLLGLALLLASFSITFYFYRPGRPMALAKLKHSDQGRDLLGVTEGNREASEPVALEAGRADTTPLASYESSAGPSAPTSSLQMAADEEVGVTTASPQYAFCPRCGQARLIGASFCAGCGFAFGSAVAPPSEMTSDAGSRSTHVPSGQSTEAHPRGTSDRTLRVAIVGLLAALLLAVVALGIFVAWSRPSAPGGDSPGETSSDPRTSPVEVVRSLIASIAAGDAEAGRVLLEPGALQADSLLEALVEQNGRPAYRLASLRLVGAPVVSGALALVTTQICTEGSAIGGTWTMRQTWELTKHSDGTWRVTTFKIED
jgi:hypothetical protein